MIAILVHRDSETLKVLILPRAGRIGDEVARAKFEEAVQALLDEGWTISNQNSFSRQIEEVRVLSS